MQGQDTLISQLIVWFFRMPVFGGVLLVMIALASAIAVVAVSHGNRQMFGQLQEMKYERDSLDSEYEKLLLEQSAWTEYSRVEELSVEQLAMESVSPEDTIIIRRGKLE